jgi:hypothetical protein
MPVPTARANLLAVLRAGALKRRDAEFAHALKFRDAMQRAIERERDRTPPNPRVARWDRSLAEDAE